MKISKEMINPAELAQFDLDNFEDDVRMEAEEWDRTLDNGYSAVYVARNERGHIAAVLVLKTSTVPTGAWYFYSVAVANKYRRMGLARRMFHNAIRAEIPFGIITSHCHVDNESSIALHNSLGFKAAQYVPDFYGDCEDAIMWQRPR